MPLRLDHIGLTVSDLERSVRFYSDLLGQAPYFQELYDVDYIGGIVGLPGAVQYAAFFHIPGQESTFLELIEYRNPRGKRFENGPNDVGTAHLCLECEDLDAEWERLVGIGATAVSARPVRSDYGVYEGARSAYFRDPDGMFLQVVELKGLLAREVRSGADSP